MGYNLQKGQTLYWVWHEPRKGPSNHIVTIDSVGRKWAVVEGAKYRVSMDTLIVDGGNYSSPARCYLSRESYESEKALKMEWEHLARSMNGRIPAGVTVDDVCEARRLLGL